MSLQAVELRNTGAGRMLRALVALLALQDGLGWAEDGTGHLGRPLTEVLESLRAQGLNLIYSTAVVGEGLVVTVEPKATTPRAILDEILPPLGLEARNGPGGAVLVVRAALPAPGKIRGRVVSDGRRTPVARASVSVAGTTAHATTLPDGTFEIVEVQSGIHAATFRAQGFVDRSVADVRIAPGETRELFVTMVARPTYAEEIVVTPSRHAIVQDDQAAGLTLNNPDSVLVPTIGGDISRVIERLPGVAGGDNSAAFNVRGSEAQDVALVLDGLELYEPFHLQGFQSPFSFIDSEIVDTIDFVGGGFTVDFGDRHGGLVGMSTGLPTEPYRTRIELGTLNSRLSFGAPAASGSLLLSMRAWYPEAVRDTIEMGEVGVDPRFADVYVKYSLPISPRSVVSAHALAAYDRLEFVETDGNERVDADSRSAYVWLRALQSWSPSVFSETTVSAGWLERSRRGVSEPEDVPLVVQDDRTVGFLGLRHGTSWEISGSHLLRGGFQVSPVDADYRYSLDGPDGSTRFRDDPSGKSLAGYGAYRAAISERLATEVGARWDRQTHTDDNQFSPRFHAIWRPGPRSEVRFGIGRFYQSQRVHELDVEDGETSFLPAELSRQAELTFQHHIPERIRVRLDAYDRRLSRVQPRYENLFNPMELFPETEQDRVRVAPQNARSRGVELFVRSDSSGPLYWWTSYAWSSAEDDIDGTDVPRSWDQTHAGKFLVAYRWDPGWSVSLSGTAHTGWPTTPVSGEATTLPDGSVGVERVLGPRNSDRFPTYTRLDVKASRAILFAPGRLRIDLEVVNLTDRNNVCCVDEFLFDVRPDGTVDVRRELGFWLGITPSVSVLWEF